MIREAGIRELFQLFPGAKFDEPMRRHTSLRIGGPADVFIEPKNIESLRNVTEISRRHGIELFPLGGGTNVLVRDGGIRGVVVSTAGLKKITTNDEGETVSVYAGAGLRLQRLVELSAREGLSGIEGLAGIPGRVGGAVCGNAGAFGREIKDVLVSVSLLDSSGEIIDLSAGEAGLKYRNSSLPRGSIILGAELRLGKDAPASVSRRTKDYLKQKKERQPLGQWSAGCVFKNPSQETPAGRLIDEAGLKGRKTGDVEVSPRHANFFINGGNGTADEFLRLMEAVAKAVNEMFGVQLEPEIIVVGEET